jgi:hypothetical protein
VRREIEVLLVFQKGNTPEAVEEIRKKIEAIANEAPSISQKDWDAAVRNADRQYFGSTSQLGGVSAGAGNEKAGVRDRAESARA